MKNTELKTQAAFFQWHWNTFPEERGQLCAINNNSENAIKGSFNMAIGVVPGASDMFYVTKPSIIFIEWKTETGVQSEKQKEFQRKVEAQGQRYVILRTLEEGKQLVYEQHETAKAGRN